MTFTFFDIAIFSLISLSTLLGFFRGFFYILVDNIALVLSIAMTILLAPCLEPYLLPYFKNELLTSIISYAVTYITLSLINSFILSKISMAFILFKIPVFDTLFGGFVGLVRGILFALIIFTISAVLSTGSYLKANNLREVFTKVNEDRYPSWLAQSVSAPYLGDMMHFTVGLISPGYLESINVPSQERDESKDERTNEEGFDFEQLKNKAVELYSGEEQETEESQ